MLDRKVYSNLAQSKEEDFDVAMMVQELYHQTGNREDAIQQVALQLNKPYDVVNAAHKSRTRGRNLTRVRNSLPWLAEVTAHMESDPNMQLMEACKLVHKSYCDKDNECFPKSPQVLAREYSIKVAQGIVKFDIKDRIRNRVSDIKPKKSVRTVDHKKMLNEYKYYINTGTTTKADMVARVGRAFKGKYTDEVISDFLSGQPKWEKLK